MLRAKVFLALALLGFAVLRPGVAYGDDVVTLNTRPDITQSFLLLEPQDGYHGFKGARKDAAQAVVNWLLDEKFSTNIDVR
jgi:hypothetical protein